MKIFFYEYRSYIHYKLYLKIFFLAFLMATLKENGCSETACEGEPHFILCSAICQNYMLYSCQRFLTVGPFR